VLQGETPNGEMEGEKGLGTVLDHIRYSRAPRHLGPSSEVESSRLKKHSKEIEWQATGSMFYLKTRGELFHGGMYAKDKKREDASSGRGRERKNHEPRLKGAGA